MFVVCTTMFFGTKDALATSIDNKTFMKNETWSYSANPYNVYGNVFIPKGVTLTVGKGVQINMHSAKFVVENGGKIILNGTESSPVAISQDELSRGFEVKGSGSYLEIQNTKIVGGKKVLDLSNKAEAFLTHIDLGQIQSSEFIISSWNNSSITITSSNFENLTLPGVLEVFGGSALSISDSYFNRSASVSTISIFGSGALSTVANIEGVTIENSNNGIEVFNGAIAKINTTSISNSKNSGVLMHDGADVEITNSTIAGNNTGIESYNSSSTISENIIEKNKGYGAYISGGNVVAIKNWWGDKSGPYFESKNIQGQGDNVDGNTDVLPWLQVKPQNEKCCSSVLFIPGIEGSRLYQGSRFGENQLWEPNRNADAEKLFLNENGLPINSNIYGRDIILKTNIGLGRFDRDIYSGLSFYLNKMDAAFSIRDWQYAPYDWRLFPQDIVSSGFMTKEKTATTLTLRKMEDQVKSMASISKTKKVTIVAHSYGGIVAKSLVKRLDQNGNAGLIDKLILIGVPEEGSVSALAALLHGDNQDIGRGYILNQSTARALALNMPSIYMVLPNQKLLNYLQSIPIIKSAASELFGNINLQIFDQAKLLDFLNANNINRPISKNSLDTHNPLKANSILMDKSDIKKSDLDSYQIPEHIKVYNILGTGLKTLRAISYIKNSCPDYFSGPLVINGCGIDHIPIYSNEGDGVVSIKTLKDRIGLNVLFDMYSYNKDKAKNFSHADLVSSEPILNTIGQIIFNRFQIYKIPDYIQVLGGTAQVTVNQTPQESIQFKVSEGVNIQAIDKLGLVSGYAYENKNTLSPSAQTQIIESTSRDITKVINNIPNSSYASLGANNYLLTDNMPKVLNIIPAQNITDKDIYSFTLDVQKIKQDSNDVPTNTNLFQFKDIPIESESKISVEILEGSSTPAIMKVDNSSLSGDKSDIQIYQPAIPNQATGNYENQNQIQGSSIGINVTSGGATGISSTDFLWLISKMKNDLQSSSIRKNFKQRYISRLSKIESYFKAGRVRGFTDVLTRRTAVSLELIKKELKRSRPRYYTGGLTLYEATYLQGKFADLGVALNKVISYANL